jgi:hypothetical protein
MAWKFYQPDPSGTGSYGTSLPTAPYDGQIFILVDSVTAPTYEWRFRYNAGSASAYKWEFIGGTELRSPTLGASAGSISTSSLSFVDITGGPTLTVPRSGEYLIAYEVFGQNTTYTAPYNLLCQALFSSSGALLSQTFFVAVATFNGGWAHISDRKALVAGETVKLQVKGTGTHTSAFYGLWLSIIPVRVS